MTAADSLRIVVPSGGAAHGALPCGCAGRPDAATPHAERPSAPLASLPPMADSLRIVAPSGGAARGVLPCGRAVRADAAALHVAHPPAPLASLRSARCGSAWSGAGPARLGGQVMREMASSVHRGPGRGRRSKAQGKIKGRGTSWREKAVCTWGWHSTHQGAVTCCERAPCYVDCGEGACFARRAVRAWEGADR
jgi:hypothetical protein